eukprot:360854-Chlamydomonas_euryale.AAC.3
MARVAHGECRMAHGACRNRFKARATSRSNMGSSAWRGAHGELRVAHVAHGALAYGACRMPKPTQGTAHQQVERAMRVALWHAARIRPHGKREAGDHDQQAADAHSKAGLHKVTYSLPLRGGAEARGESG